MCTWEVCLNGAPLMKNVKVLIHDAVAMTLRNEYVYMRCIYGRRRPYPQTSIAALQKREESHKMGITGTLALHHHKPG